MNKTENNALPELLAPAGSADALLAAVSAGADAVYFGAEKFSARARAKNLAADEMKELFGECRARGVRTHGALNIRMRDAEFCEALALAEEMLTLGADALIVADAGLAREILRRFPEAELHASTQITGTGTADAEALSALGFRRMVCPRELSLGEIRRLAAASPIPIEMFIHGAHCVSVSGQCLMSCVLGGRSGNRGDCAGTCRLPFAVENIPAGRGPAAALSLRDMCTAGHIRDIIASGVASLKIEGRQKSAEYVYGTVKIYRSLLDERRDADPEETFELARLFSRDGFSDGYLRGRYVSMLGQRQDADHARQNAKPPAAIPAPGRVGVTGRLRLFCGERVSLTLSSPHGNAEVFGGEVSLAVGNPPPKESLRRSIAKLGATPFELRSLEIDTDGRAGISAAALNELRRAAAAKLLAPAGVRRADSSDNADAGESCTAESQALRSRTIPSAAELPALRYRTIPSAAEKIRRTAEIAFASQLTDSVRGYFDEVYLPLADFLELAEKEAGEAVGVSLPAVAYDAYDGKIARALELAGEAGAPVLVHTVGELRTAVSAGCRAVASHRFSVYNSRTAGILAEMGASCVTLSPEIPYRAAEKFSEFAPVAAVTGGRLPLMLCRRCPTSDGSRLCPHGRAGGFTGDSHCGVCKSALLDRTGARFPVVGDRFCMSVIYNSVETYSDATEPELLAAKISSTVHIFSCESARECDALVDRLRAHVAPAGGFRKFR